MRKYALHLTTWWCLKKWSAAWASEEAERIIVSPSLYSFLIHLNDSEGNVPSIEIQTLSEAQIDLCKFCHIFLYYLDKHILLDSLYSSTILRILRRFTLVYAFLLWKLASTRDGTMLRFNFKFFIQFLWVSLKFELNFSKKNWKKFYKSPGFSYIDEHFWMSF